MREHRTIRVAVTFNRTFYFVDKGVQRGIAYETGKAFEDALNKTIMASTKKVHVVFLPLPRDLLATALLERKGDAAVAQVSRDVSNADYRRTEHYTSRNRRNPICLALEPY